MLTKILPLFITLSFNLSQAYEVTSLDELQKQKKARELIQKTYESLIHVNQGCPLNSGCEEITGKLRQKWLDTLKKAQNDSLKVKLISEHIKNYGLPVTAWITGDIALNVPVIVWDSPCKHHRPRVDNPKEAIYPLAPHEKHLEKEIFIGEFFVKNYSELKELRANGQANVYHAYYHSPKNQEIIMTPIPREERPLYLDGDDLIVPREDEGIYYNIAFSPEGRFKAVEKTQDIEVGAAIECPKDLVQKFLSHETQIEIYDEFSCRSIWDIKSRKTVPILYGRSCI